MAMIDGDGDGGGGGGGDRDDGGGDGGGDDGCNPMVLHGLVHRRKLCPVKDWLDVRFAQPGAAACRLRHYAPT
eukprot:102975-Pelagomonas_calceolata.AAC.1